MIMECIRGVVVLHFLKISVIVLIGICQYGCKPSVKKPSVKPHADKIVSSDQNLSQKHTVIVMDTGFDIQYSDYKDKIMGSYSQECGEGAPAIAGAKPVESSPYTPKDNSRYELSKKDVIGSFQASKSCYLSDDVTLEIGPKYSELLNYKTEWNNRVKEKKPLGGTGSFVSIEKAEEMNKVLGGNEGETSGNSYDYHGTATAGVASYNNSKIRMILVQVDPSNILPMSHGEECLSQEDVNLVARLYKDKEVQEAYSKKPLSSFERDLFDLINKHNVTIINKSFGYREREKLEEIVKDSCGTSPDYKAAYQAMSETILARQDYIAKQGHPIYKPLTVIAAGNNQIEINSVEDTFECSDHKRNTIVVGAYTHAKKVSEISNFGRCVDFFAFGETIIVPAPKGFLRVTSGTSFAAPLAVNFIAQTFLVSENPSNIISQIKTRLDQGKYLPVTGETNAVDFLSDTPNTGFSLTLQKNKTRKEGLPDLMHLIKTHSK